MTDALEEALQGYRGALRDRNALSSLVISLRSQLEDAEARLKQANLTLDGESVRLRASGWRPPHPHSWRMRPVKRPGSGFSVSCRKCGTRLFLKSDSPRLSKSDFQFRLKVVFAFCDRTLQMPNEFCRSMTVPSDDPRFDGEVGLHGRMANDCDLTARVPGLLEEWRQSHAS